MPRMRTPWHRAPTPRWKGGFCSPKLGLSPTRMRWYRSPLQAIRITPTVRRAASLLISLTGRLILPSPTPARIPSMRIAQAPPPLRMVRSSIWSPPPTAGCTRTYRPNPPGLWRRGLHYESETEPLSPGGGCYAPAQDRRRGDAHIVGYYAPEQRVKPSEGLGHRGGVLRGLIQDPANGLPRKSIPRTWVNKGLLDCLLALPGRIGTQPQRDVCGLHSLPYHPHQVFAQGVQVCFVAQLGREGF